MIDIAQEIKIIRKTNHLTQQEFADSIYVSRSVVAKWESGINKPSLEILKKISETYNVPLSSLVDIELINGKIKRISTINIILLVICFFIFIAGIVFLSIAISLTKQPHYTKIDNRELFLNLSISLFSIALFTSLVVIFVKYKLHKTKQIINC